jgi:two-component system, NarL family, sensor kinase
VTGMGAESELLDGRAGGAQPDDAPATRLRRPAVRGEIVAFLSVALLALLAVAAGILLVSGKVARDTAREDAETAAVRLTDFVLEPLIGGVIDRAPGRRAALEDIIDARLTDGTLVLLIVWTADGDVVYSSNRALETMSEPPTPELDRAIAGEVVSNMEDEAELGTPPGVEGPLLEVYVPLDSDGTRYAFEGYFTTAMIDRDISVLVGQIVPVAVGALVVLQLVQIPIAVSLARRLSRTEAERAELSDRHLAASERERRMIAADVHDGPVQDLAGLSYSLAALRPRLQEADRPAVDRMTEAVRNAVTSLRRLMIEIYPPDLSGPGLRDAIEDLSLRLRERDVTVHVEADTLPDMEPGCAAVLYRSAKEALANVVRHAQAMNVWITLEHAETGQSPAVRLVVADDGVGLEGAGPDDTGGDGGHLGLRLLRERVTEAGGTVRLTNRPEGGTVLEAVVPVGR